uniref:Uncharacterized protein n=1 Tax=Seriola dumerili TaxID=41447 RepID=A0A3B4T5V6_SERDU
MSSEETVVGSGEVDVLPLKLNDAFNPQCLLSTVKHGSGAVMVGAAIYWGSLGLMIALHDCITAKEYEAILQSKLSSSVIQNTSKSNDFANTSDKYLLVL